MKTIRLTNDQYNRLLDMLEFIIDVRTCSDEHALIYVKRAEELASTIVANTNQHDSGDEEAISDVEKRIIERHVHEFMESLDERKREALLYFIDPVGWSKGSRNYALHCLLRALLGDD